MPRRYYDYTPDEEYMQSLGGPYFNPYSSAPIDIGMALRQNLSQLAAYKQYEREMQAKRQQQDFDDWIKMTALEKSLQGKPPTAEEEMWASLTREEKRAAGKKKYLPAEEHVSYPPEVRTNIEKQLGLPPGTLATAPDTAITQALGKQIERTQPEKGPKKDETLEGMKTAYGWFKEVKKDLENEAKNIYLMSPKEQADFQSRQTNYKRNEIFVRGVLSRYEIGKRKPNPREMRFFEEMMKNPYADIHDLLTGGISTAPTPSSFNQIPAGAQTATNPQTGQRVYYDEKTGQWLPIR